MKKRVVSLLLCLIMALSLIPTAAFATEVADVEETTPAVETQAATDEVAVQKGGGGHGGGSEQPKPTAKTMKWDWLNNNRDTANPTTADTDGLQYVKVNRSKMTRADTSVAVADVQQYGVAIGVNEGYYLSQYTIRCHDKYGCQTAARGNDTKATLTNDGKAEVVLNLSKANFSHSNGSTSYWLLLKFAQDNTEYTVTYDWGTLSGEMKTGVPTDDKGYKVNATVNVLNPSDTAIEEAKTYEYQFDGWTLDGTSVGTSFAMPQNNVTLVAQWTKNENPTGNLIITKNVEGGPTGTSAPTEFNFNVTGPNYNETVTVTKAEGWTKSLTGLSVGEYTVTETGAGIDGYDLKTTYQTGAATAEPTKEKAQVEVKANTDATVTVTNTYTKNTTSVTVAKEWSNDELVKNLRPKTVTVKLMKGTTAYGEPVVLNATNQWSYTWTDLPMYNGTGSKITYSVKEVNVPAGYKSETLDVSTDNEPNNFVIKNTANVVEEPEIVPASLTVIKTDADNGALLKGAKFALIPEGDKATDAAFAETDDNGEAVFTDLAKGTYTLKEVTAPAGYQATDKTWTITVSDDAETAAYKLVDGKFVKTITCTVNDVENVVSNGTITITNAKNTANLVITKKLNEALPVDMTFKFNVMKGTSESVSATITIKAGEISGTAIVENRTVGTTYTVQEVAESAQLDGYTVAIPEAQQVKISGVATDNTVTFENVYTKNTGTLTISKVLKGDLVATDFDKPFTFTIWMGTKEVESVEVWPGNPVTLTLDPGKYTIVEDKADVEGYDLTTSFAPDYWVEVKAGEDTAVVATNTYTKTVTPAPVEHTFTIDITKNIELLKRTSRNPGKASFTFEAYMVDEQKNVTVLGDVTIETRGTKSASGKLTFTLTDEQLTYGATVYVREVEGNARGWTYDDTIYELKIGRGDEILTGDTDLTFTNVYYRKASSNTPTDDKTVKSVKTGDMGIAMYAMTSLLSLGGAALVIKKRKDEK